MAKPFLAGWGWASPCNSLLVHAHQRIIRAGLGSRLKLSPGICKGLVLSPVLWLHKRVIIECLLFARPCILSVTLGKLLRRVSSPLSLHARAGDGGYPDHALQGPMLVWGQCCSEVTRERTCDLRLKGGGGRGCHSLSD